LATCSQNDIDLTQNTFKFQHDRVQQAAYSLIPETERAAFHLHIAHRLLADASEFGGLDGTLFEIVGHFNKGMGCLGNREERLQAARLNLQAGLKARKSSAFHASWDHFRIAHQLLPKDSFETDYELALPIHLGLAKSSYLAGKCEGSEALYCLLLEKARTRLDKSQVHIVQMEEHHLCGAYDKAIEVQKQNLSLLGEQFPENEQEFSQAIERELRLTTMYRGTRNMDDLIAFRKIDSPEIVEALKTFMSLWISAYLVAHESLVQWCSIRMANLCLQHGNSDMAAFAYVQYGFLCISRLEKFEEGYEYGDLALKLADRCDSLELRGKTYFMFAMCIGHWKTHVSLATETLRKGYAFSSEGGDWTYAVYAAIHIISNLTIAGAPCDAINAEAEKYLEFLQDKAAVGLNAFFVPSALCSLLNLQGKTRARGDFSCQYLDEQVFLNTLCGSQPNIGAWFYTQKLRSSFHYRCFEPAARLIADTENIGRILPTQFLVHEAHFYSCLTMAAAELLSPDAANLEHYWSLFDRYEQKMKLWAEHCPENYLHKYYLIRAERARVEHGDLNEVLTWYDKAIQTAREGNFPNDVALGHELKGRYWLERRQKDYGLFDLKEARYRYQLWGAAGKVAMLEEEFSELAFREDQEAVITPAHLDLLSVHKAARAISAKIEVRDLIQTMMTIVMESAGADRGALLLEKDGAWQIEACADVGDQGIEIDFPANSRQLPKKASSSGVPYSVVNYVLRTQTPLTVSEPLRDHRFGQDPYVISVIPRSILCVPVVHLGRTSGIIYLENKLGPDVFSADRRDLIDVLAGQIAISLENAALYADLKNTVAQQSKMMEELNRVSAQRQIAEAETQRLNAELEERVQDRTAELTRSNQELEQFAYVASHDLQEPLRKVSSFAQLLASQYRGKLDADADEFLGYMVDGARRMQSLIQNLLSYSRLGRKGTPFALVDVNLVLEQALFNLQGAMDDSGAEITSCPLPTVLADEAQLVQLFQNLIGNAIKFHGTEKTRIQIGAESNGTACTFSVRDNGIGIDPQYAERIFQIFQRLHTREEYPGTGIGLSFCKKIVERHGGRIWVESQLPVHGISTGTAFHFTLPQNGATNHEHP
jgi:signal transduction histidine kinase